jgi:DNA-binding MarR family transcriptional regulator/transposase
MRTNGPGRVTDETSKPSRATGHLPPGEADITIARLQFAATAARKQIEQILRPENLGWREFVVLRVVRKGRIRFYQAAAEVGMVKASLRIVVYGLIVRNLVVRIQQRARVVVLELTSDGRRLVDRLSPSVQAVEESMLSALTPIQRAALGESLQVLTEYLPNPGVEVAVGADPAGPVERRRNPDPARRRHPATDDVVDRYGRGGSLREVAEAVGLSHGTIRQILIAAGVTLRPRGGSRPGGREGVKPKAEPEPAVRLSDRRQDATVDVVDRYRGGQGMHQIAATVGLSYNTVRNILTDAGIELRPSGRGEAERGGDAPAARHDADPP